MQSRQNAGRSVVAAPQASGSKNRWAWLLGASVFGVGVVAYHREIYRAVVVAAVFAALLIEGAFPGTGCALGVTRLGCR